MEELLYRLPQKKISLNEPTLILWNFHQVKDVIHVSLELALLMPQ